MIVRLEQFFFETARVNPGEPALSVNDITLSYAQLAHESNKVSHRLAASESRVCLLFASRSVGAYAGVLGILNAGKTYVPLNPKFPAARNAEIARRSGARIVLVDQGCRERLDELLDALDQSLEVVYLDTLPEGDDGFIEPPLDLDPAPADENLAYILFTSGTTGPPKGVCIGHDSAVAFIESQKAFYPRVSGARYSQNIDLTFDPSVQDMFLCWANGGCLCVPESLDPMYLADFIKRYAITHWCSVPSIATLMRQFRKLSSNAFPSLQVSTFGGEALAVDLARAWARAAPASRIVNAYGPTEATVASLRFELTPGFLRDTSHAITPIGSPWEGVETCVIDEASNVVAPGQQGELVLGGKQLADGYISDNERDHEKFYPRRYEGMASTRWYRTGDVVRESADEGYLFRGRTDHQIKLLGNRIELLEVEDAIRQSSGAEASCVIPWPLGEDGTQQGLVAFVLNADVPQAAAIAASKRRLPAYAVPSRIIPVQVFPLNVNGKVDRNHLTALLELESSGITQ